MKTIIYGVRKIGNRRSIITSILILLTIILTGANLINVDAQGRDPQGRYDRNSINQAQQAVRNRIIRDIGGGTTPSINFNRDANSQYISNNETRVTGTGSYYRGGRRGNPRNFTYEATVRRNGRVTDIRYTWDGDFNDGGNWDNGGNWGGADRPTGNVRYRGPIINEHSGKGLDVSDRSTADGANIQQWDYANQGNQNWEVINVGRGEFAIVNRRSGKVLDVPDNRIYDNGVNIQQYRWNSRANQRWRLENAGSGWFRIVNSASGKCLDVDSQSRDNGATINQWDCGNQESQRWRLSR
jgi:hypothetical protein